MTTYLRFTDRETAESALTDAGMMLDQSCLWPAYYAGDNGRIWRNIDAETCEDIPGIHVNVEADSVPESLAQYVVATPLTPFTVLA